MESTERWSLSAFRQISGVWVDIEITRLQPDADGIIDIAMLVTDVQLAIVAEGRAPADERAGCRSWRRIPTTTTSTSPR